MMNTRKHLLLIVDDHDATRRALAKLLDHDGWDVLTASTIAEGIDLLGKEPNCVVLDLMLPDGDGEAVLLKVRQRGLRSRVAITTATGDEARLAAVQRLGPDAILRKPFDLAELRRVCSPC
jgi:DNA-binding response OmpR family regulator